ARPGSAVRALPLTDARSARVGQDGGADRLKVGQEAITLDRGADLLRSGRDEQGRLDRETGGAGLAGHVCRAADVLVRGVGAGPDQRVRDVEWEALRQGRRLDVRDRTVA